MLKNKETGQNIRISKEEINKYDLLLWVNPQKSVSLKNTSVNIAIINQVRAIYRDGIMKNVNIR